MEEQPTFLWPLPVPLPAGRRQHMGGLRVHYRRWLTSLAPVAAAGALPVPPIGTRR